MDYLQITGGKKLSGSVTISGAKNAALPIIAATILSDKEVTLTNLPDVVDIRTLLKLLSMLGGTVAHEGTVAKIDNGTITSTKAVYEIVSQMRASILVLGPLLARFGECEVSLPGGCAIGQRPIDLHLKALEAMGATIEIKGGYVHAMAPDGLKGANIIFDKITLLVDLYGVVTTVMPEWAGIAAHSSTEEAGGANILVVEDSKFFMNQITDFVSDVGYTPFQAEDGVEALRVLEEETIHLVLTDIEMPNMDGLELTRQIRADERWAGLPVIAVTSVAGEAAEQRGQEAGVDEYLIKLDREQILSKLNEYLGG